VLSAPLVWLLAMFALAGPLALNSQAGHTGPPARSGAAAVTSTHVQVGTGSSIESPDSDSGGSPGVLALPPEVHLVVNRTGTGTAPPAPVLAVLAAPVDRTDAGIRIATDRAGTTPADAPPANSRWERAPPRAFA
jgi:hypothetical protein